MCSLPLLDNEPIVMTGTLEVQQVDMGPCNNEWKPLDLFVKLTTSENIFPDEKNRTVPL